MSANKADLLRRRILSRLRFHPRRRSSSRRRRTGPGRCNASLNTTPFRPGGSSGFQRRNGATAGIFEIYRRLEHHHGNRSSTSSRNPGNPRRCTYSTHYWTRSPRSHGRTRRRRVPRPPRPPRTRPPSRAPLIPRGTGSTPDIHRCSPRDRRSRQTSTSSRRLRAYQTCTNSTRDRTRRRPQRRPQSHSPRTLRQRVPRTRRPHDTPLPSRARTCPRGKSSRCTRPSPRASKVPQGMSCRTLVPHRSTCPRSTLWANRIPQDIHILRRTACTSGRFLRRSRFRPGRFHRTN